MPSYLQVNCNGMKIMNAIGAELKATRRTVRSKSQIRFRRTNWGYAATELANKTSSAAMEKTLKALGILMIPLGAALLFMPQAAANTGTPVANVTLAVACAFVGFALFVYAKRGLVKELHIDPYQRQLRAGTINANGDFTARQKFSASDVESFFLMRAKSPAPAQLCTRLKKGGKVVKLMKGSEDELVPILENVSDALRPKNMANKRVRTRVSGAFILATFE